MFGEYFAKGLFILAKISNIPVVMQPVYRPIKPPVDKPLVLDLRQVLVECTVPKIGIGKGLGQKMFTSLLESKKSFGFTLCYMETKPNIGEAQKRYHSNSFDYADTLIEMGFFLWPIRMIKSLV